jgi:post-segregation antitoxin (ccd killing protein)
MAKRKQTIQWLKENREYNDKKKTDNTMAKRKQTIQWLKENRQYDG